MSAVYLGRRVGDDPDSSRTFSGAPMLDGRVVALKIARHDVAKSEPLVRMFLEEGKLLARLVHPSIVRTLEVGGDAEQGFIAMELMLGKTYAAIHDALVARNARLSPELAAWACARVADALHYAHELTDEAGRPLALVHRDVNPANVFATFDGDVKLFDFGLAKVTVGETVGSPIIAGKLSYLSPEQLMQMPLDRRSDVFSLGVTLWELLTSRRLFRRDTDVETVRAVQLGPIPDPRSVAPEVPDELARVVRTALERNRDHRCSTAADLARELDAFVLARSSPAEVTARIGRLVDTLFPGERRRQSGWLKPAIARSMSTGTTPIRVGATSRPPPPEVRRDGRETTVVMSSAPPLPAPPRGGPPATRTRPSAPPPNQPPPKLATPMPFSRTEVQMLPPGPASRTATQIAEPTREVPTLPVTPTAPPRSPSEEPAAAPRPRLTIGPRPKRGPIPLPSRASSPPKAWSSPKVTSAPPPDDTPTPIGEPPPNDERP